MPDLSAWTPRPRPQPRDLEGRWCRLEPLDGSRHGRSLYEASTAPGAEERFRYLLDEAPPDRATFDQWVERAAANRDALYFAAVDIATGRAEGRQALMRIDPAHGAIEIGSVLYGPAMARSRVATEAVYLFAEHVFSLGYRRFEWKCDSENLPSRRAAERFGFRFEGEFRQHMVIKGRNRDTAWFSMLDHEWPLLRAAYQAWLAPENFDPEGRERRKLAALITRLRPDPGIGMEPLRG